MPRKKSFFGSQPGKGKQVKDSTEYPDTDLTFVRLVRERKYQDAVDMIEKVHDINVVDPQTCATALHFAAHRSVRGLIAELEKRDDLNYLVQDREGRYPSELAWEVSGHEELGAKLARKEKEQADRDNVKIWPKAQPPKDLDI